jgi:hypothetical protein
MNLEEAKRAFPAIFVIYRNPRDFPNCIVVRAWYGNVPGAAWILSPPLSVDDARAAIARTGRWCCLGRSENDDPVIVESWI